MRRIRRALALEDRALGVAVPTGRWALGALRALRLASALVACIPDNTGASPASPTPATDSPSSPVYVLRQGQWYAASIVQLLADGRIIVHYDKTGNEWNEAVPLERVKSAAAFAAMAVARDYKLGDRVPVPLQNRLFLGEVIALPTTDVFRVHLDGYGPEVAENLAAERLRHVYGGLTAHPSDESVVVDVSGQVVPGKVLAAITADRWLVRPDGSGPQNDTEVGPERIRSRTAPPAPASATVLPPAPPTEPASAPAPVQPSKPRAPPEDLPHRRAGLPRSVNWS